MPGSVKSVTTPAGVIRPIDATGNSETGTSSGGISSSELDLEGLATHEFGHVVGGWTESTDEGHFDNSTNPNLCGSGVSDSDKHTMCTNLGSGLESWYKRSLQTHDTHTFQDAYV
jgi:hypothetical protein